MRAVGVIFVHFDLAFGQILVKLYLKKALKFIYIAFWLGDCALADVFNLLNSSTSLGVSPRLVASLLNALFCIKIPLFKIARILADFKFCVKFRNFCCNS